MKRYKLCGQYSEWGMVDLETDDYFFDNDDGEWVIASEAAAALEAKDAEIARMGEVLGKLHHAACGETGFAACVRLDSGKAYPWPALDEADAMARAALQAGG